MKRNFYKKLDSTTNLYSLSSYRSNLTSEVLVCTQKNVYKLSFQKEFIVKEQETPLKFENIIVSCHGFEASHNESG